MPAKPTAGHPTLADACAALAKAGLTSAEIGARLEIDTCKASALTAYRLGKEGINRRAPVRPRRRDGAGRQRTVLVDHLVLDTLAPPAARRGVTVNDLVRALLREIAADPTLVDAVLDDAADLPPQPRQVPA